MEGRDGWGKNDRRKRGGLNCLIHNFFPFPQSPGGGRKRARFPLGGSPFIRLPRKWEVREWLFGIYLTHRLSLKNSCVSLLKLGLLSPFFLITSFRNGANTIRQAGFCNYSLLLFSLFSSPFYEQFSSEKHLNLTTVRQ